VTYEVVGTTDKPVLRVNPDFGNTSRVFQENHGVQHRQAEHPVELPPNN